jgi:hypothetical protein
MSEKSLKLPEWWPEPETLRCLHASNFDYAKAFRDINVIITWRAQSLPIKLDQTIATLIRSGFFTVYGRDIHHRVVLVVRPLALNRLGINDYNSI